MARPAIRPPNRLGRLKLSSKGLHVSEVVRSCEVGSGPDGDSKGFIIPKHSMGLPYIYIYICRSGQGWCHGGQLIGSPMAVPDRSCLGSSVGGLFRGHRTVGSLPADLAPSPGPEDLVKYGC